MRKRVRFGDLDIKSDEGESANLDSIDEAGLTSINCPFCNKEIKENNTEFCDFCGSKIKE